MKGNSTAWCCVGFSGPEVAAYSENSQNYSFMAVYLTATTCFPVICHPFLAVSHSSRVVSHPCMTILHIWHLFCSHFHPFPIECHVKLTCLFFLMYHIRCSSQRYAFSLHESSTEVGLKLNRQYFTLTNSTGQSNRRLIQIHEVKLPDT